MLLGKRTWLTLSAVIALSIATGGSALAFSIFPVRYFITADAGSEQDIFLTIKNDETTGRFFQLRVAGLEQDEKGRAVLTRARAGAVNWVRSEKESLFIKAGGQERVRFTVSVPFGARPGAHYFALSAKPQISDENATVGLSGELATAVLLQVAGEAKEEVAIDRWQSQKNFFYDDNWGFILEVANRGNIDVPLAGKLIIRDWRGRVAAERNVAMGNNLFAGATRVLRPSVAADVWRPGLYRAEITAQYGRTRQTARAVDSFWFLPPAGGMVGAGLLVVALGAGGLVIYRRRAKRDKEKKR